MGGAMPDWRNPDLYSYTASLTTLGWAWEFLRRNNDYRAAFDDFLALAKARFEEPERPDLIEMEKALRSQLGEFGLLSFHFPDDPIPNPLWSDFTLFSYPDPDRDATMVAPLWLGALGFGATPSTSGQVHPPGTWVGFPHSIELTFSFTKPLDTQLEMAHRFLKECERKVRKLTELRPEIPTIRFSAERFALYLRLLDAHAAGESIGEMGRVLFGAKADTRNSAKSALDLAKSIAAGRYKELLWLRTPGAREGQ
jgi:hypothetical protein